MPKKVLKPFWNGKSILQIQLDLLKTFTDFNLVLATTDQTIDDSIENFGQQNSIKVFRGSEDDVLDRFIRASSADYLIRICSDNPFLQMGSIGEFLKFLVPETDYISYKDTEGIPSIKTHWGLYPELVSRKALIRAHQFTKNHSEGAFFREHVTNYIYGNPTHFKVQLLPAPELIRNRNDLRFTIDTPEDFENMQRLYKIMQDNGSSFTLENLIKNADAQPEIKKVMQEGIERFSK